jgi:hypothetical protein
VDECKPLTRGLVTRLAGAHGEGDVVLLAAHQTTVHSLLHQASGIPMACINVPMVGQCRLTPG